MAKISKPIKGWVPLHLRPRRVKSASGVAIRTPSKVSSVAKRPISRAVQRVGRARVGKVGPGISVKSKIFAKTSTPKSSATKVDNTISTISDNTKMLGRTIDAQFKLVNQKLDLITKKKIDEPSATARTLLPSQPSNPNFKRTFSFSSLTDFLGFNLSRAFKVRRTDVAAIIAEDGMIYPSQRMRRRGVKPATLAELLGVNTRRKKRIIRSAEANNEDLTNLTDQQLLALKKKQGGEGDGFGRPTATPINQGGISSFIAGLLDGLGIGAVRLGAVALASIGKFLAKPYVRAYKKLKNSGGRNPPRNPPSSTAKPLDAERPKATPKRLDTEERLKQTPKRLDTEERPKLFRNEKGQMQRVPVEPVEGKPVTSKAKPRLRHPTTRVTTPIKTKPTVGRNPLTKRFEKLPATRPVVKANITGLSLSEIAGNLAKMLKPRELIKGMKGARWLGPLTVALTAYDEIFNERTKTEKKVRTFLMKTGPTGVILIGAGVDSIVAGAIDQHEANKQSDFYNTVASGSTQEQIQQKTAHLTMVRKEIAALEREAQPTYGQIDAGTGENNFLLGAMIPLKMREQDLEAEITKLKQKNNVRQHHPKARKSATKKKGHWVGGKGGAVFVPDKQSSLKSGGSGSDTLRGNAGPSDLLQNASYTPGQDNKPASNFTQSLNLSHGTTFSGRTGAVTSPSSGSYLSPVMPGSQGGPITQYKHGSSPGGNRDASSQTATSEPTSTPARRGGGGPGGMSGIRTKHVAVDAIPREGRALLEGIASVEAGKKGYNAINYKMAGQTGRDSFSDMSRHPFEGRKGVTAAGRYQQLASNFAKYGKDLPDFGKNSQDIAAWRQAKHDYHALTKGGDLEKDMRDPNKRQHIIETLSPVWLGFGANPKKALGAMNTTYNNYKEPTTPGGKTVAVNYEPNVKGTMPGTATASAGTNEGMKKVGNYKEGVDPRLTDILDTAAKRSKYKVEAFSGQRPGDTRFHGKGMATDVSLIDPATGKPFPNYQNAKGFRRYEEYAQEVRRVQMEKYPELAKQMRWGGYFSGPKGKYGAADTMHFDLGGSDRLGMAGGSWEKGLNSTQRKLFPGAESVGMADQLTPPPVVAALTPPKARIEEPRTTPARAPIAAQEASMVPVHHSVLPPSFKRTVYRQSNKIPADSISDQGLATPSGSSRF